MEGLELSNFWQGKKVAVTGATGIVGSWLVKDLLAKGANISALIYERNNTSELIRSGDIQEIVCIDGDLRNIEDIQRMLDANNAEYIFHLGAQTIVGEALQDPLDTFESNIMGTWNLMEAVRIRPDLKGVLVASSDKAYGTTERLPYNENTPLRGEGPYDVSKSCTDLIASSYFKTFRVPIVIARCGNIYGGGDVNWSRIVPGTIRSLLNNEQPVIRSNGKFLRDYIYVQDAVSAYLHMAEAIAKSSAAGEAFNFSRQEPISVLDIYSSICHATVGHFVEPLILDLAKHEIIDQHLDSAKARSQIGWESKYTLSDGLALTVDWYRTYFKEQNEKAS